MGLIACDNSPNRPSPPQVQPQTPIPTAVRLAIDGAQTVAPGATAQFTATAAMSDGSTRDVTAAAAWQASSSFASVVAGLVTGRNRGEATISARYSGLSSTRSVMVLPDGTFRLTGTVVETIPPIGPVSGVRVEVVDGPERGQAATSAFDGSFKIYGLSGDVELRFSKAGYATRTERLGVNEHRIAQFGIAIVTPLPDLSGRYTMTVRAAEECADRLPEIARERSYPADIVQGGPRAQVTLGGATFSIGYYGRANRFTGIVEPASARWDLYESTYYYTPSVQEELGSSRFLAIFGTIVTTADASRLTGTLDGTVDYFETGQFGRRTVEARCRSTRHAVSFIR